MQILQSNSPQLAAHPTCLSKERLETVPPKGTILLQYHSPSGNGGIPIFWPRTQAASRLPATCVIEFRTWWKEQHTLLQVAFEGTRERLRLAAERQKKNYDQHVQSAPFEERSAGIVEEFVSAGTAPKDGGPVYTIAPVDDHIKIKVHRYKP